MHKARYNALQLTLRLSPRGPLLVKSGETSANPSLPDMQFVRTYHPERGETVYIPGSSLKGVVRSFVEKALRTLETAGGGGRRSWQRACPTFADDGESCARRLSARDAPSHEIYRDSCGACRLFGHTRLRGRAAFSDFLPVGEIRSEVRYGVAISRLSHAVAQGPFEMEVVVAGAFQGHLLLENFELWQLGLVGLALEGLDRGLLKLGFGKNRGFGEVAVEVQAVRLDEAAPVRRPTVWRGLAAFLDDGERQRYGLDGPSELDGLPEPGSTEDMGLYVRRTYDARAWRAAIQGLTRALAPA